MATACIKYMQRSPTAWLAPAQDSPPASRMNRRGAARTYHMYLFWGAVPSHQSLTGLACPPQHALGGPAINPARRPWSA